MAGISNFGGVFQGYGQGNNGMQSDGGIATMAPRRTSSEEGMGTSPFSHKAPTLATDMRCYFGCKETFKKDYDLRLHLKIKHKNEDQNELKRAYQDAEEEIALTRRSYSTFQCALCPKQLNESGAFSGHIRKTHKIQWQDYKDKYGRCEIESAPFECKICGRVVKYGSHTVHVHLKNCHNITWMQYLDRIRKMRKGEAAEELPSLEFFECKVCNAQVKFMFRSKHLKGVHKITEPEYIELFKDDLKIQQSNGPTKLMPNNGINMKPEPMPTSRMNMTSGPMFNEYASPKPQQLQATSFKTQYSPNMPTSDNSDELPDQPMTLPDEPFELERNPIKPPKSDIQDKNNKKCSACMVTFDSRRNFIEHCTTFHSMKFRTVSGATISGPLPKNNNIPHPLPGVKREQEDGGMDKPPANKFSKQSFESRNLTNGVHSRNGLIEPRRRPSEEDDRYSPQPNGNFRPAETSQQHLTKNENEGISTLPLY